MKTLKHRLIAMSVLTGALSLSAVTQAADEQTPTQPVAGRNAAALRERMRQAARDLNLTEEQKEKMRPIVQSLMERMRGLREETNLTSQEKVEKIRGLREEFAPEVKKVLTPEQFEKWQAMQPRAGGGGLQEALKDLILTDEQKEKLKPIFQEQMEKVRELRQNQDLSAAEKLERLKAMREAIAPRLKEVLSAEQFEKVQRRLNEAREQMQQRLRQRQQN